MPPKFLATTACMTTCAGNKDAHPGHPDMPAPWRTHAEVEEAHKEAVAIEAEASAQQDKAVEKVAAIEDEQCQQDEACEHKHKKEHECKNAGMFISHYMQSYLFLNLT